jgi:hypothetical protein
MFYFHETPKSTAVSTELNPQLPLPEDVKSNPKLYTLLLVVPF